VAANAFYTPEVVSKLMIGALVQDLILPRLVNRQAESDFGGGSGTVINIRTPPVVTGGGARTYDQTLRDAGTPIVLDRLTESTVPLTMGPMLYKGVPITDEDFTFELTDFTRQVVEPVAQPVGIGAEKTLADVMNGFTASATITPDTTAAEIHAAVLEARMTLNKRNVPVGGRILLVSPEIEMSLLIDEANRLVRYQDSGSTEALRNATIGRLYGMSVIVTNELTANTFMIFDRDAFAFVLKAPPVPAGCTFGASISYQGLALRMIRDYDPSFMQDRLVVNVFAGASVLDAQRAIRVVATPGP
jgi:hypothetical protein